MADVVFDTLGLARRLRERAGFSPEHAEETAQAIADTISGPVATKPDLSELRLAVKADLTELRSAVNADLAELRSAVNADLAELRSAVNADLSELRLATRADLAELKSAMTRLVLTVATGQVALLLAAMFSLARLGH